MPTPLPRRFRTTLAPDGFHGYTSAGDLRTGFFEGWYVKVVSVDRAQRLAFIPGVFIGETDDAPHEAFVQVLDGATGHSWYHSYPVEEFSADTSVFDVTIGPNRFTSQGFSVDLPSGHKGSIAFTDAFDPWPVTPQEPGCMGWYAWMPFLECYHGVCSFGHGLAGSLQTDTGLANFDLGRGYVEKDWGQAFPAGYVWAHSNHFSDPSTSLMASIAIIPWVRSEFRGFVVGLKHHGRLFRFATYTGAQTVSLDIDDETVRWTMRTKLGGQLDIVAERRRGGLLHAPIRTEMHQRVEETLDAKLHVRLTSPSGAVILDDTGEVAGLEVHGDIPKLLTTN
jgi:hypothetical protein